MAVVLAPSAEHPSRHHLRGVMKDHVSQNRIEGGEECGMGPIEVVIISFPRVGLVPGISRMLEGLVASEQLRIVDAILVTRGQRGKAIVDDLNDTLAPGWSSISPNPRPLLSAEDANLVVEEIADGGASVLCAIEHVWPEKLRSLVADGGGILQLHARIDPHIVETAARVVA